MNIKWAPLSKVYPVTEAKEYSTFEKSFEKNGIINPIIVVLRNKEEWDKDKEKYPFFVDFPDEVDHNTQVYQIRCGHNRYKFARQNNHSLIKVLICSEESEVGERCKEQQRWYKNSYK